jgi:lysozyme family protein
MRTTVKLALAVLTATALLGSLVVSASARSFSISNRNFRAVWAPLTFFEPFGFFNIGCNLTMEGSFHSNTIAKVGSSLIGYVTRASFARPCAGAEFWVWNGVEGALTGLTSLPWHINTQASSAHYPT